MRQSEAGPGRVSDPGHPLWGRRVVSAPGCLIASFLGDAHPEETIGKLGYIVLTLTIFGPCAATGLFLGSRDDRD